MLVFSQLGAQARLIAVAWAVGGSPAWEPLTKQTLAPRHQKTWCSFKQKKNKSGSTQIPTVRGWLTVADGQAAAVGCRPTGNRRPCGL